MKSTDAITEHSSTQDNVISWFKGKPRINSALAEQNFKRTGCWADVGSVRKYHKDSSRGCCQCHPVEQQGKRAGRQTQQKTPKWNFTTKKKKKKKKKWKPKPRMKPAHPPSR